MKLTDLNISVDANLRKRGHSRISVITADLSYLGAEVLGLAHGLDVDRVLVLVDSAEQAARGRSGDGELRERDEGRGEDGTAEHFDKGGVEERVELRRLRFGRVEGGTVEACVCINDSVV